MDCPAQKLSILDALSVPLISSSCLKNNNCKTIPACSCPRLHNCCGEWEGWDPVNWLNHTSWVAIVTQTDRPKGATIWFLWGGGGAGRLRKKKISGSDFREKILRHEGPAKKVLRLAWGSAFALRNLFSHSKFRLSQSKICFRSLKSAFAV